ncbi:MAG TPA: glycosyltransferase [Sphingobacteriaceae bacterium]|nr:glycosyltransferase [Sphingobacteriaceae bacterium]
MKKIPILLLTHDRPNLLEKVLKRLIKYTNWNEFDLWILDNFSTTSNTKIINLFKDNYPFINIYSTRYNQVSQIQNDVIKLLKAEIYIKLDDDILVSENWTKPFIDVFNRNYSKMSFGSVVIPINGFGWLPFLEIMDLKTDFQRKFPEVELKQDCMDVAVFNDKKVNEYIWEKCYNIDDTARTFIENQKSQFLDLQCPHRYSIGAIIFSHETWRKMGGWKVQVGYEKVLARQKRFQRLASFWKNKEIKNSYTRLNHIADIFSGATSSEMAGDEIGIYNYSQENDLIIPVTTQGIVFHFSFGPVDSYLMSKIYLKLQDV